MDRARDAVGDDLKQRNVVLSKGSVLQPSDVKHAEKFFGAEERDAEHHLDALFPENRIRDGRGVDAVEANRTSGCRDPSCEPSPDRDANALAYLLLDPAGCRRDEFTAHPAASSSTAAVSASSTSCTRLSNSSSRSSTSSVVIAVSVSI